MPSSFFAFQQGSDTRARPPPDAESLRYGRFRAFSPRHVGSVGNLFSLFAGGSDPQHHRSGYGSINFATGNEVGSDDDGNDDGDDDGDDDDDTPDHRWWLDRKLVSPRRRVVCRMVGSWWRRWAVLVALPALLSIVWCMIPFPTFPLPAAPVPAGRLRAATIAAEASPWSELGGALRNVFDFKLLWDAIRTWFKSLTDVDPPRPGNGGDGGLPPAPGHGSSRVAMDFWFFLFVYYGFYNLVGLLWITKVFNMYGLNWWPVRLGFPATFTLFNCLPLACGAVLYYYLPGPVITQNLTWIFLTFATMCTPLVIAFAVLLFQRQSRRLGVRQGLSETQLLFSVSSPARGRYLNARRNRFRWRPRAGLEVFYLPRSYRRFLWFCGALLLTLIGFVLGEAYAELYLRTLPHTSLDTVLYVWSWVATIHTLDITSGWIIGAKVGSYPLGFVFKTFWGLTYQTYVRAIYARLRSPSQFAYLQLLSSSIVVLWTPLTMTSTFHRALTWLGLNNQDYAAWKKYVGRAFYIRGVAESVSMVAWLGWVVVLHYGWNTKIYPYFSFRDEFDPYTFSLTFWASVATWACELAAGYAVRRIMARCFRFDVTAEAVKDFKAFPELLPACVAVSLHVLQNMLFSIVRLRFY